MTASRTLRFALLALATLSIASCTKKSEDVVEAYKGPTLVDSELAHKIPGTSSGFLIWDSSTEAYKRYAASPWGKGGSATLLKALEQVDASGKVDAAKPFIDVLTKTGLLATQPGQPEVLKAGVGFIDLGADKSSKPGLGVYLSGNAGNNLKDKLSQIEQVFTSEGYAVTKRSGPPEGFAVEMKDKTPNAPSLGTVFFAATENLMAVVTQEPLLSRLFGASTDNGLATIVASPAYQKTLGSIGSPDQLSVGYIDVTATINKLLTTLPAEGMQEMQIAAKSVPLEVAGWTHQMGQGLADTVMAQLTPRDDEQKRWMATLSGSTIHDTFSQLPNDAVFSLSFDGGTLARIRDTVFSQMDPNAVGQMKQQLAVLDSIKDLTIAVRGAGQTSPFPELFIVVSGSSASAVQSALKSAVNDALLTSGLQLGDWQSKEVEGTKLEMLMSPLGVGAFQAQVGNSVVLATSEGAVVDTIKAAKDSSKSLQGNVPASTRQLLAKGSMLFIYSNFDRMTELVQSVQGNLAMFTGGQSAVPEEALEQLRKLGIFSASVALNADILRVETRYDAVPNAAK